MFGVACGPYIDGMYRPTKPRKQQAHLYGYGCDARKSKGDKARSRKERRQRGGI